jgi:NAD(P)-dependent dehydrogenase (short-subunit alcohol dehydrogenase family)
MERLRGKAALITGAGAGIGKGIARRFAREGARIVVAEIDEATGRSTVDELRDALGAKAEFVQTDVADRSQVEAAVARTVESFGAIHILVNNAWSGGTVEPLEAKSDATVQHAMTVGYMAAFWSMRAAFPHMVKQGGGRIINMCSLNGVNAHMFTAEYNAAKEALRALTRTAAREWAAHKILANVICPAAATAAYEAFRSADPENAAALLRLNPMGRMGDAEEDIGGVALFLASDDSRYVTGNTLYADGGSHINGVPWAPDFESRSSNSKT